MSLLEPALDPPLARYGLNHAAFDTLSTLRRAGRPYTMSARDLAAQPRRRHDLAGVGEAGRVEGAAQQLHGVQIVVRVHPWHVLGLVRPDAVLLVVGDVRPDDIERRVRALFGAWERRPVPAARYGEPPDAKGTTVYVVDKPGAAQSEIRVGHLGVPRSCEDYFPLSVMNALLGGLFTDEKARIQAMLDEWNG